MSNQQGNLAITPKRLGLVCIQKYCPRCFWYLLQQRFHPPFNIFGGAIFKYMEKAQIAVISDLIERKGRLPKEFAPLTDLVSRVEFSRNWRKFQHRLKSGILLYGEPDDICEREDGTLAIIDHKTASPSSKDGEDPLTDLYHCQVTGYGLIAQEGQKLGEVSTGGLFYWTVDHHAVLDDPGAHYFAGALTVDFIPTVKAFRIDFDDLDAPLKEAQKIWELTTPPDGTDGCEDCRKLDTLLALQRHVEKLQASVDQHLLASSGNDRWVQNFIRKRMFERDQRRLRALAALRDESSQINFSVDGVVANWEIFEDR
jgi:hypothetical protein